MNQLKKLFREKPYLAWYIKDKDNLSEESMVEHILNYGDWGDYLFAEKTLGIKRVKKIFERLKNKRRVSLRPQTVNYFSNYYQKYA